jgi:hypothetical protein
VTPIPRLPFHVKLSAEERAALDAERARRGLRSEGQAIRAWLAECRARAPKAERAT